MFRRPVLAASRYKVPVYRSIGPCYSLFILPLLLFVIFRYHAKLTIPKPLAALFHTSVGSRGTITLIMRPYKERHVLGWP